MEMDIDIKDMEGYVFVDVSGTFTIDNALTLFEKMLIYITVTRASRILIDIRKLEGEFLQQLFELSKKATELQDDYTGSSGLSSARKVYLFDGTKYDPNFLEEFVYSKNREKIRTIGYIRFKRL